MVKRTTPATETESPPADRATRVLVVVDARMRDPAALETAAALAARMRAELDALLVEDESLSHLAGLPFAQEIDRFSGTARPWDAPRVSRTLRVQHQMLSRIVTRLTESRQIATRVRVARGHYRREALAAAAEADVTFFSRSIRVLSRDAGATDAAWLDIEHRRRTGRPQPRRQAVQPVWVLYDGGPAASRALGIAAELATQLHAELRVLLLGAQGGESVGRLRARAQEQLSPRGASVHFVQLTTASAEQMVEVIAGHGASFLCVARGTSMLEASSSQEALERLTCPVVVVG